MTRGGRAKDRDGPERRCIATGESGPVDRLIRFVAGPDGAIVPDLSERLPGRGIWLTADRDAVALAVKKRLFARAARAQVAVPEDLAGLLAQLLEARLVDLVAMARKAGQAVAGHDKVHARLKQGGIGALLEATDGSEQGRARLRPLAGGAPVVACLDSAALGLAFARDRVIHAALDKGGISDRVLREAGRLTGLRTGIGTSGARPEVEGDPGDSGT